MCGFRPDELVSPRPPPASGRPLSNASNGSGCVSRGDGGTPSNGSNSTSIGALPRAVLPAGCRPLLRRLQPTELCMWFPYLFYRFALCKKICFLNTATYKKKYVFYVEGCCCSSKYWFSSVVKKYKSIFFHYLIMSIYIRLWNTQVSCIT